MNAVKVNTEAYRLELTRTDIIDAILEKVCKDYPQLADSPSLDQEVIFEYVENWEDTADNSRSHNVSGAVVDISVVMDRVTV